MESRASASREVWIDYLRAFITLLVLAHHSALAYTTFARMDTGNFLLSTAPIVDAQRWVFLDYAENFNDVFFMSLMFFISGLFVWPALRTRGTKSFLRDRLLRLGLPFLAGVVLLAPLAYYPSWLASGGSPGYLKFWIGFIKAGWAPGPVWFIWVLLLFDVIASGAFLLLRGKKSRFTARSAPKAFMLLFAISFLVYVPMLVIFGFGTWIPFFVPPLWFQVARFFLYLSWFSAGIVIGANGIADGILAQDGPLARRWPLWIAACVIAYNLLWFAPGIVGNLHAPKQIVDLTYVTLWVLSCCASCFGLLALFRGVLAKRWVWMDSIARPAYGMYIIHYAFVIWIQYFLMRFSLSAGIKFSITCAAVILTSWVSATLLLKIRRLRAIL